MTADALQPHRPPEPVVGVRVRDGAQGGQAAAAHRRGAGPLLQGPRGPRRATTCGWAGGRRGRPAGATCSAMFLYAPDFFLRRARAADAGPRAWRCRLALVGGPIEIGGLRADLHWMLLGPGADHARLQRPTAGGAGPRPLRLRPRLHRARAAARLTIDRGSAGRGGAGRSPAWSSTGSCWSTGSATGFALTELSYPGVFGLLLIVLGFQTFTFTLLLQMRRRRGARAPAVSAPPADGRRESYGERGAHARSTGSACALSVRAVLPRRRLSPPPRVARPRLRLRGHAAARAGAADRRRASASTCASPTRPRPTPGLRFVEAPLEEALPGVADASARPRAADLRARAPRGAAWALASAVASWRPAAC